MNELALENCIRIILKQMVSFAKYNEQKDKCVVDEEHLEDAVTLITNYLKLNCEHTTNPVIVPNYPYSPHPWITEPWYKNDWTVTCATFDE